MFRFWHEGRQGAICVSLPNHYFCVNFIKTYSSHTLPFPLEVMLLPRPLLDAFTSLTFCSCCPSVLFVLTCAHLFVMSRRCDNDQEVQKYKNGELESTREYNPGESHLVFSSLSLFRGARLLSLSFPACFSSLLFSHSHCLSLARAHILSYISPHSFHSLLRCPLRLTLPPATLAPSLHCVKRLSRHRFRPLRQARTGASLKRRDTRVQ